MPSEKLYYARAGVRKRIQTLTINSATATNIAGAAIGPRTELYTIGTGMTTALVAAALAAQLQASLAPEFQELSYSPSSNVITITSIDTGVDFVVTAAGTGGVVSAATVQTATGGMDWANVDNWGGALPVNGDSIVVDIPDTPITMNLDALAGVDIATMTVRNRSNRGAGLTNFRRTNGAIYIEYRGRYVQLKTLTRLVVEGDGPGPDVLHVQLMTGGNTTCDISSNNSSDNDEVAPIQLLLKSTGNKLNLNKGYASIPKDEILGLLGVCATVNVGREGDNEEAPFANVDGTVSAVNNYSGQTRASSNITLFMGRDSVDHLQTAGNLTVSGSAGNVDYRPAGTITFNITENCTLYLNRSTATKTLGSLCSGLNGGAVIDPNGTMAGSFTLDQKSLQRSRLKDGTGVTVT